MAKNEVYRAGEYVPAPVPQGTKAGSALRVGTLNLVTVTERSDIEGQYGNHQGESSVDLGGGHILPVTISGGPLTWGQPIYVTAAGKLVTATGPEATPNQLFGAALEYNVPNGTDTPVVVKILN